MNRSDNGNRRLAALVLASATLLAGCLGGDGTTAGAAATTEVTVTPSLGKVSGAAVTLRKPDGTLLGSGAITAAGTAKIAIDAAYAGALIIEVAGVAGATYFDEATGAAVGFPVGELIRAVADTVQADVGVTTFTEMAYQAAKASAGTEAALTAAIIRNANSEIRTALAPDLAGSLLTPPALVGSAADIAALAANDAGKYAARLAALAHAAKTADAASASPALAMLHRLRDDMSDGTLDDAGGSAAANLVTVAGIAAALNNAMETALANNVALRSTLQGTAIDTARLGAPLLAAIGNGGGSTATPGGGGSIGAPVVSAINPASGAVGTTVTISGSNFDPSAGHMLVTFGGGVEANVSSVTSTQIVVTVPESAVTGTVVVTNGLTGDHAIVANGFTVVGATGGSASGWTKRSTGSAYILNTVAHGNGLFVAAGLGSTIVTSADGTAWTTRSSSSTPLPDANYFGINGVAWSSAAGRFVAVGDRLCCTNTTPPLIATSADGINWTRASLPEGYYAGAALNDVTADASRITAVGAGYIFVSSDGATWTAQTFPDGMGTTAALTGVASSGTVRVAVGYDTSLESIILVSSDGATWSRITAPAGFAPQDVTWSGGLFVAVGSSAPVQIGASARVAVSADGQTWTLHTLPEADAIGAFVLNDVAWTGSRFLAVGSPYALASGRLIVASSDGASWTVVQHIASGSGQKVANGVAGNGSLSVTVGDSAYTGE